MDYAEWQTANNAYLAAVLKWLRLRLEALATATQAPATVAGDTIVVAQQSASSSLVDRLLGRSTATTLDAPAQLAAPAAPPSEPIAQAEAAIHEAEAIDPPPAAVMLGQRFGLSHFELSTLLLCAAMELDTRTAALCARAQDEALRPYPTFALALALFEEAAWEALSPERPLRYWRFLEINQPDGKPLTTSILRADERIVSYLKGLNYLDDRLSPLLMPLPADRTTLPPSQQALAEAISQRLANANEDVRVIQLAGADSASKQQVARQVAAELGLQVFRLPFELLPANAAELETLARLWQRESVLLPIVLYLDAHEAAGDAAAGGAAGQTPLNRFVARCQALIFLDVREVWPQLDLASAAFDVDRPTPGEQRQAWEATLGKSDAAGAARLAGQFNLNWPEINQLAHAATAQANGAGSHPHDRAWEMCLMRTRPHLDALAQRIDPRATWETLVLPDTETRTLKQIGAQVEQRNKVYDEWGFRQRMNRGLGISALFAGPSGTGKTMAAEVIANELQLNLYRIDLSAVVSKYIGETEKNLRRLFDAAEGGGVILFFDEADALFGKRSEVKDSHDRYANIEINYLLQRIEAYRGLAILATNMKSALDPAFMRRLRFTVNFPFPGAAERKLIWQKVFPRETPLERLDFDRLARFNLAGGNINNIAINAAFLAAHINSPVTMKLVLEAARAEYGKLEQPMNEAEFRM